MSTAATQILQQINWRAVREEGCELLRQYIRFNTTNDPDRLDRHTAEHQPWRAGSEAEAIGWLAHTLRSEGVEVETLQSAPGRMNLIARIPGHGRRRPLILLSHADVVPADPRKWLPGAGPFSASIHNGYIHGRGALDLKGLGIVHLMSILLLRRYDMTPERDVILVIVADEEAGGHYGAEWLLRTRPELRNASLVLGEGAYSLRSWKGSTYPLQAIAVAEKGYLELELRCEAKSHHASMPEEAGAAERLTYALSRLLARKRPARLTPATHALLRQLGVRHGGAAGWLLQHPAIAAWAGLLERSHGPIVDAMLHDTLAVTILEAGYKSNVLPDSARAILSIRLLPGTNPDHLTEDIRSAVNDPDINIRRLKHKPPTSSEFGSADYRAIANVVSCASATITPILSPGASDCRFWRAAGVPCYGWIPFGIDVQDLHSVHGSNERVSIDEFGNGIQMFFHALLQLAISEQRNIGVV